MQVTSDDSETSNNKDLMIFKIIFFAFTISIGFTNSLNMDFDDKGYESIMKILKNIQQTL